MGGAEGDAGWWSVHGARVELVEALDAAGWDALVLVTGPGLAAPVPLKEAVAAQLRLDPACEERCAVSVVACGAAAGGRLVLAATGDLTPYHDVRSIGEAMSAGVSRALRSGARRPVVLLPPHPRFPRAPLVALLAALEALYTPLQTREWEPERAARVEALGVCAGAGVGGLPALVRAAVALEDARGVARDIGGADPERMTPLRAAEYLRARLAGSAVRVSVLEEPAALRARYPLFAAVSRAADTVPRHRGCIVFLEYEPAEYDRTLLIVGKGVTYDTGGCDIKAGGAMAGMSRDKCGAAAAAGLVQVSVLQGVTYDTGGCDIKAGGAMAGMSRDKCGAAAAAGLVQALATLEARVKVVCALALVRNSVGEEAYVADELIRSRGGQAVRVGNTDAEGRMAMADLLAEMAERAPNEKSPHVYTIATLTGHAHRAVGEGYSIVMDNHAASERGHAARLQGAGHDLGDMIEISTIRREDLQCHAGRAAGDGLQQADNKPSTMMPRGHQGPAAFLLLVSGLCAGSTPYSHLDVAASAGSLPAPPTAAPLLALAALAGVLPKSG